MHELGFYFYPFCLGSGLLGNNSVHFEFFFNCDVNVKLSIFHDIINCAADKLCPTIRMLWCGCRK